MHSFKGRESQQCGFLTRLLHPDKDMLEKATQKITEWLKHMGLVLSPKKTRVTHTLNPYEGNVGFDFLGYTVRQFSVGKTHTGKDTKGQPLGYKTINKPSKKAIKTHIQKTNHLLKKLKSAPQKAVVGKLNPVIRGWCNYHKVVCAKKVFHRCDSHLYVQLMEWGRKRHHNKGKTWIYQRYWHREDGKRWVFAAPVQTEEGMGLLKLRRHNSEHGELFSIQCNQPSCEAAVRTEASLPQAVCEQHDTMITELLLGTKKTPSQSWLDSE